MSEPTPPMKQEIQAMQKSHEISYGVSYGRDQIELLKRTVAKGATDDELKLFLYTAKRTGLDPLLKQIHAVKRWSTEHGGYVMTIQTGIDGYRLIAERTHKYVPGREPSFTFGEGGTKLVSATAYIKKFSNGEWHEIAATAFFDEYAQKKKDGTLTRFWQVMPKSQLAKCAEALAIRRAFPAETSGVKTWEEMEQADNDQNAAKTSVKLEDIMSDSAKTPAPKPVSEVGNESQDAQKTSGNGPGSDQNAEIEVEAVEEETPVKSNPRQFNEVSTKPELFVPDERKISDKQQKMLFARCNSYGISLEYLKVHLQNEYGLEHTRDLTRDNFNDLLAWLESERVK